MRYLKYILLSAVGLFMTTTSFAQISEPKALSEFVSAQMAYKNGRYEDAVQKYRQIIDGGLESGAVYYNLGNSYYREGDVGKAVLNYERAKRLIPRDSDLKFNERYVISRIPRHDGSQEENFLRQTLHSFVDFYTLDEMVWIITALIVAIGMIFLSALYGHWPQSLGRGLMIFLAVVAVVYTVGLADKIESSKGLAVILEKSESYFEPRNDSTVHFRLSEGMKARILKKEGNWTKIERLDGKAGWVPSDVLERI